MSKVSVVNGNEMSETNEVTIVDNHTPQIVYDYINHLTEHLITGHPIVFDRELDEDEFFYFADDGFELILTREFVDQMRRKIDKQKG